MYNELKNFYDSEIGLPIGFKYDRINAIISIDKKGNLIKDITGSNEISVQLCPETVPSTYTFNSNRGSMIEPFGPCDFVNYFFGKYAGKNKDSDQKRIKAQIEILEKFGTKEAKAIIFFLSKEKEVDIATNLLEEIADNQSPKQKAESYRITFKVNGEMITENSEFQKFWSKYILKDNSESDICDKHLPIKGLYGANGIQGARISVNGKSDTRQTFLCYGSEDRVKTSALSFLDVHKIYGALNYLAGNRLGKMKSYLKAGNLHMLFFGQNKEVDNPFNELLSIIEEDLTFQEVVDSLSKIKMNKNEIMDKSMNIILLRGNCPTGFTRVHLENNAQIKLKDLLNNINEYIEKASIPTSRNNKYFAKPFALSCALSGEGKRYQDRYMEKIYRMILFNDNRGLPARQALSLVKTKEHLTKPLSSFLKFYQLKENIMSNENSNAVKLSRAVAVAEFYHQQKGTSNLGSFMARIKNDPKLNYNMFVDKCEKVFRIKKAFVLDKIYNELSDIESIEKFTTEEKIIFINEYRKKLNSLFKEAKNRKEKK